MRTLWQLLALCVATTLAACSVKPVTFTPDDGLLAEDCATAGDEDSNGLADCSDPACSCTGMCQVACGNGKADPGEQCDDGNAVNGDTCDINCTTPGCGNGVVDPGEQCDDGNAVNGDTCDINCTAPDCGNGVVDPGEQC